MRHADILFYHYAIFPSFFFFFLPHSVFEHVSFLNIDILQDSVAKQRV